MKNLSIALKSLLLVLLVVAYGQSQEPVFSGPQPGETIVSFEVRSLMGTDAGKQVDYVKNASGKPLLLVFVHDINRQSIALVRSLTSYSATRRSDHLQTGVIMLSDDANEAEQLYQRMKHALNADTATGVSLEGREGPGSYGLNRLLTLTILLAKDNQVVANYALVQPSLQVDLPKIVKSITDLIGGPTPSFEELVGMETMRVSQTRDQGATAAPDIRSMLRPLIQKSATNEVIDEVAQKIENAMQQDEAIRREIYRIATAVTGSGELANYGNPKAQDYLTKWAKESKESGKASP